MVEARARGYFGIGAEGVSKSANIGALLRTGHAFDAAFCFTIGSGWDSRAVRTADTADTPSHVPLWRFQGLADLRLPRGCSLVGIELLDDAVNLPSFRHPLNAAYVLGPERSGLSAALLQRCDHLVRIPTRFALNLAVAGALVLYDRLLQHGRFAERAVGSMTVVRPLAAATRHGPPKFRRTIPDWLATPAAGPNMAASVTTRSRDVQSHDVQSRDADATPSRHASEAASQAAGTATTDPGKPPATEAD